MSTIARLGVVAAVVVVAVAVAVAADSPSDTSGKAGAPGQVCKHLKVKGKKTDEQRAAFKACIQDAVAERKGANADKTDDDGDADNAGKSESGKAGAPGQVCKHLKVKGKKTDEQRAAFKACIQDAVAERKADSATSDEADDKRVPRKNPPAR